MNFNILKAVYKKSNIWYDNTTVEEKEEIVKKIKLRNWQQECSKGFRKEFIKGSKTGGIINATTGAGKTITILSLLNEELKYNDNSKIIIAVPQRDISYGFCKKYKINGQEIEISNNGCFVPTHKTKSILNFLKFKSKHKGKRTLVCTHQALIRIFKNISKNKQYFKNLVIVVDEAHHIDSSEESNELGKIENYIFNNKKDNLKLLLSTATLFRGDRKNIVSDINNYYVFKLPLDRHFEDNCTYLKNIKYDFSVTDNNWENSISNLIKKDDKTILFIPHTSSKYLNSDKMTHVRKIIKNLADDNKIIDNGDYYSIIRNKKEFRIVDLVDDINDNQRKNREKYIYSNPNDIDMVLAMCKFKEGSDWIVANNIIIVGIRNSLTDLVQMSGRSFRDHISKKNKAVKIVQIIPNIIRNKMKENISEKVNEFFQCLFSAFIFEEILKPRKLVLQKEERLKKVEQDSDGNYNYHELFDNENDMVNFENHVIEQLDDFKANNEELSKRQLMNSYFNIVRDLVIEEIGIKNKKNVEVIAKDIIKKYKKRTKDIIQEIKLPSNDIKINFNMIREEVEKDDVLGYRLLLSTGIWGISDSKRLRETIGLSLEASSNAKCHEVCDWMDAHDRKKPSQSSKDSEEKSLGNWISTQKLAKKGKGSGNFYESNVKIIKKRGYADLFDRIR